LKIVRYHTVAFAFLFVFKFSLGQGRIVINEFMPWAGCSTTSEFIELMNFGPGPMDIGCFIVTNGIYSVTIPPNTILQRGQYFVLSGQDVLAKGCGNTDSTIQVDLNWTSCNCTNASIPTTGDGFLQNGGNGNDKVVLLDPNLNVIDAVSTNIPVSSSSSITTPALNGCSSKTFNLGTMSINYESTGPSTGNNNSIARKVDGDCGWVKTTAISAHAPNKTGSSASATYDFTAVSATQCNTTTGSISIQVNSTNVSALFPMNYTLAFDADGNGVFNSTDQYIYGVDNSSPTIDIDNLSYGRYRIAVGSSSSCNLKSYDFFVFNCYTLVLPVKLLYFNYEGNRNGRHIFKFKVDDPSTLNNVVLEAGDGTSFHPTLSFDSPFRNKEIEMAMDAISFPIYRLKLTSHAGIVSYSQEVKINSQNPSAMFWPNPVSDKLFMKVKALSKEKLFYSIINSRGQEIVKSNIAVGEGEQTISITTSNLPKGLYYFKATGSLLFQPFSFSFLK
jgi:hypothetical protein